MHNNMDESSRYNVNSKMSHTKEYITYIPLI